MLVRNQLLAFFLLLATGLGAQMSDVQIDYIERFNEIAVREMERAGIPASIKLAQGLLESNAGRSDLARRARNHFGMKCGANWEGDTMYKEDDDYDENGRLIKSCFRAYRNADASYVAHSEFLRDPRKAFRYGFLFRLDPFDYKAWAFGLKRAGYATSPTYPEKLISLIERYQLYQYDKQTLLAIDDPTVIIDPNRPGRPPNTGVASGILRNNDVGYTVAFEDETLEDIARRVEVSVSNLLDYNESLQARSNPMEGDRIYVQPKRNAYRGQQKFHVVKPGETMMDISQEYAVKLSKLLQRNRLDADQEPAAGEKIKLRGWCKVKETPQLRSAADVNTTTPSRPAVPTTPTGELEMEEPEEEFIDEEFPARPGTSNPGTTSPSTSPTSPPVSSQPERPKVIINPGSQPASPPPTPETKPSPIPANPPATTQPAPPPVVESPPASPISPSGAVYHTVQGGETLWAISQRYNTTVDAIKQLNGLTSNNLSIGMQLRVK